MTGGPGAIRRLVRRVFRRAAPAPEGPPLDWPRQKAALIDTVTARVSPLGLKHQSAMDWYAPDAGSFRSLTMNWGSALDFVPHVAGSGVHWHRTFASARRDLWLVPTNDRPQAHRAFGTPRFEADLPHLIDHGLARAAAFWAGPLNLSA